VASLTILINLREVRIFGSMVGGYSSSSGVCRPDLPWGVSGSCSDKSSEDGVKGRDTGGVGGDGGQGKDGCGLDGGVPGGEECPRSCPRSSSSSYACVFMNSMVAQRLD